MFFIVFVGAPSRFDFPKCFFSVLLATDWSYSSSLAIVKMAEETQKDPLSWFVFEYKGHLPAYDLPEKISLGKFTYKLPLL